ncbi:nuclear transport factor 2 family protein [Streptomyces sp. NA04227]|uniref:nuclear transport factor 2 family protein n=1 Tax=Streptomyces sp. NA04227 TaxID=2742136 RepID=UPI001591B3C9|nr:nuclear transport factor 2 family protein [Streptomyces sp. NA04227]QKW05416.1 nuclear transport factor 2 family protein [Streptomyces sp. NA04227]
MGGTSPELKEAVEIVARLAEAKCRQDVAASRAVYHRDAVLESPPLGSRSAGPEIDSALQSWFAFAPDYRVRLDGHGLDDGTLCCWGEISFTPAFTASGAEPNGARVEVPVFILFRFADGQVAWESFHFDVAGVARQCGVAASDLVRAS